MRFSLFFTFLFTATGLNAQNWTALDIPVSIRYDDVFFIDDSLGWACSGDGEIYHTKDAGQTWKIQHSGISYLRSIEFADKNHGYCGGLSALESLFKTTDGGEHWDNITDEVPGLTGGICGLSCPGGGYVYGCGRWSTPAYVIKSADNGQTWQKILLDSLATRLVDAYFTSPDTGWVSGTASPASAGGVILKTTDGGASWKTIHTTNVASDYIWKLQRLDTERWFASIERQFTSTESTEILKSTDNGESWSAVQVFPTVEHLQMVGFLTPLHGWTGDDKLFETTDGGASWQQVNASIPFGGNFNRFWRFSDNRAMMTGNGLYRYNNPVSSVDPQPPVSEPGGYHQLLVSPNPGNGQLTVTVQLKQKTDVILKVYAIDGRAEQIIRAGEHPAGEYSFPVDLRTSGTGLYVVYLKTNHGTQQKIVVVEKD